MHETLSEIDEIYEIDEMDEFSVNLLQNDNERACQKNFMKSQLYIMMFQFTLS